MHRGVDIFGFRGQHPQELFHDNDDNQNSETNFKAKKVLQ